MSKKILCIMLIFMIILTVFNHTYVFAASTSGKSSADEIISGANDFVKEGEDNFKKDEAKLKGDGEETRTQQLANTSNFIYNLILAIAMIIAMAVGIVIGIKFMMASVTEKAEIKELLVPYVLGCIVVFGAMGIWKLFVTVFSSF